MNVNIASELVTTIQTYVDKSNPILSRLQSREATMEDVYNAVEAGKLLLQEFGGFETALESFETTTEHKTFLLNSIKLASDHIHSIFNTKIAIVG